MAYINFLNFPYFNAYASPTPGGPMLTLSVDEGRALIPGQKLTARFDTSRALLFGAAGQRLR